MRKGWTIAIVSALVVMVLTVVGVIAYVVVTVPPGSLANPSGSSAEQDDDFGAAELYTVLEDGSLDPEATGLTAEVWDVFTRVTTIEVAASVMSHYRVGDAPRSDTLAYVYLNKNRWVLAANLATSEDPTALIATLVHEYAHILSLGADEIDPATENCPTLELDEGCAGSDSAIEAFETRFWAPYGDSAPDAANTDADLAYSFYLDHEEDFVSDYAATSVVEDIAESLMTFVLEDHATGDSLAAQKLRFFEDYPRFVELRERIRAEFAEELGLAN